MGRRVSGGVRVGILALGGLLMAGCVGGDVEPPIHGAPPAPLPEIVSGPPAPGMVRVKGAWHWDGARYTWVPGHWESPPPTPGGEPSSSAAQ